MIPWDVFKHELVSHLDSKVSTTETQFASYLSGLYDKYIKMGSNQYGGYVTNSNKIVLQNNMSNAFKMCKSLGNAQALPIGVNTGLSLYWKFGVTLSLLPPPPGAVTSVSSTITSIPQFNVRLQNVTSPEVFANNMMMAFRLHASKISGLTIAMVGPMSTPFPWTGIY